MIVDSASWNQGVTFKDPLGPNYIVTGIKLDSLLIQSCNISGTVSVYIGGSLVVSQYLPETNCTCGSCPSSKISDSYYLTIPNYNYSGINSLSIQGQDICILPFSFQLLFTGKIKPQMLVYSQLSCQHDHINRQLQWHPFKEVLQHQCKISFAS